MGNSIGTMLISVVLLGMILLGFSFFVADFSSNSEYTANTSQNISSSTNNYAYLTATQKISNFTNQTALNLAKQPSGSSTDIVSALYTTMTGGVYTSIQMFLGIGDLMFGLTSDLLFALNIGIPQWAIYSLMAIVLIITTFAVISVIMRWPLI